MFFKWKLNSLNAKVAIMQKPVNCFTLQIDWNGFYMMTTLAFNELKHVRWMQEYKDRDKVIKSSAFPFLLQYVVLGNAKQSSHSPLHKLF